MQQHRRDRGIDAAREAADHPSPADLAADLVDRLGAKQRHRPVAAAAGDIMGEIAQQLAALRRVHDLGMKQHAIETPGVIGDRGVGRGLAGRHRAKAGRQCVDPVAMAHPHLLAPALGPQPVEQPALVEDVDEGAAEFLMVAQGDPAAELGAHRLHAVADPEHRHAEPEDDFRRARRGRRVTEAGPPDRMIAVGQTRGPDFGDRERVDLAIDAAFAHPPRDQLGHLAAEIEDQDAVGHGWRSNMATKNPSVPCRAGVSRR